jgi:RNA polymerase sigma-70 factor, ECF subfamily
MEHADIDALISMLTEDVTWSMPPAPTWFRGMTAVRDFLVRYPLTDTWSHRPVRAGGQLAVACYILDRETGEFIPGAIDVLTLREDKIAAVTGFLGAEMLGPEHQGAWTAGAEMFGRFGLPARP